MHCLSRATPPLPAAGNVSIVAAAERFLGRYASLLQAADLNDDLVDDLLVVASPNFVPFTGTIGSGRRRARGRPAGIGYGDNGGPDR